MPRNLSDFFLDLKIPPQFMPERPKRTIPYTLGDTESPLERDIRTHLKNLEELHKKRTQFYEAFSKAYEEFTKEVTDYIHQVSKDLEKTPSKPLSYEQYLQQKQGWLYAFNELISASLNIIAAINPGRFYHRVFLAKGFRDALDQGNRELYERYLMQWQIENELDQELLNRKIKSLELRLKSWELKLGAKEKELTPIELEYQYTLETLKQLSDIYKNMQKQELEALKTFSNIAIAQRKLELEEEKTKASIEKMAFDMRRQMAELSLKASEVQRKAIDMALDYLKQQPPEQSLMEIATLTKEITKRVERGVPVTDPSIQEMIARYKMALSKSETVLGFMSKIPEMLTYRENFEDIIRQSQWQLAIIGALSPEELPSDMRKQLERFLKERAKEAPPSPSFWQRLKERIKSLLP